MKGRAGQPLAGLALVEALLATVILAMAATATLMPFTAAAQAACGDARSALAVNLAQDLMEEILSRNFQDPDGSQQGEGGRRGWDDMLDYAGYAEAEGQISSLDGSLVQDAAAVGLSRQVDVGGVYVAGQDTSQPPTFLRITVEVRYHGAAAQTVSRLVYQNQ
jgi:type II secretory pathway pseudopilin PulG